MNYEGGLKTNYTPLMKHSFSLRIPLRLVPAALLLDCRKRNHETETDVDKLQSCRLKKITSGKLNLSFHFVLDGDFRLVVRIGRVSQHETRRRR